MACCKHLLPSLLLVLPLACSSTLGSPKFKNHTAASAATSTSSNKNATSASSAAALLYNRTLTNDTHQAETSLQSGSVSALATSVNLKGNASSASETAVERKDRVVEGEDTLSTSIKHAVSQSTTHILTGREQGLIAGDYPEVPSVITRCEHPSKCLAGAQVPTRHEPLKTVVLADAEGPSRKWRPPPSRLWVYCLDPDFCDLSDFDENEDLYDPAGISSRSRGHPGQQGGHPQLPGSTRRQFAVPEFVIRGRDLSRAIQGRGLTQAYYNTLHNLNRNPYYRWLSLPIKVLFAKMLTLSNDGRFDYAAQCLLHKLTDYIDRTYDLARLQQNNLQANVKNF